MNIIQSIIFSDPSLHGLPSELYLRRSNDQIIFDTYFNVFHAQAFKKICTFDQLFLRVKKCGNINIKLKGSYDLKLGAKTVEEWNLPNLDGEEVNLPIVSWKKIDFKFLYIEISFVNDNKFPSISFVTDSPVVNKTSLGVTIVHFNRKNWVLPALKRLKEGLLDDPEYAGKISVVVVDNSKNITPEEAMGVTIIPNENLGGTGGFTRGLLHFKEQNFTHCLFMDDDASCEVESIKRTWALLAYSKEPRFAVAGSLLLEDSPSLLYEKGAIFSDTHKALYGGFDMTKPEDIAEVEKEILKPNYGGWWFFAFRIDDVSRFPFPFFVRGDDLMFSLLNKFSIYTTNGIGCWGDDFASKSTPLACYLDGRSVLLNNICAGKKSISRTLIYLSKHFILHLLSFNYASVRAIRSSLHDTTLGVDFWKENLDMSKIRNEIASYSQDEKMMSLNLADYSYDICPVPPHRYVKGIKPPIGLDVYFKALLLNGAFLPDFLMKKKYLLIPKGKYGGLKFAFRYNKIIYYDEKTATGYVAKLNRKLLLRESFLYLVLCLKILFKRRKYRQELEEAVELYTKESFWRSIY